MHIVVAKIVPCLILLLALLGWRHTCQLVLYLYNTGHPWQAGLLGIVFHASLAYEVASYCAVAFASTTSGKPLSTAPSGFTAGPHEIVEPLLCTQGLCSGSWKPPRSRHCAHHGVCRAEFDHCCAWFDGDVCADTLKPFLAFLFNTPLLILPPVRFLAAMAWRDTRIVLSEWRSDEMAAFFAKKRYWAGGPVIRYMIALQRCFQLHNARHPSRPSFDQPSFSRLVVAFFASFVMLVAIILLYLSLSNICKGQTSVEVERTRRWRSYLNKRRRKGITGPLEWDARRRIQLQSGVVVVPPDLPIYSRGGWNANMRASLGPPAEWLWFWQKPPQAPFAPLNLEIINRHLSEEAKKAS